MSLPQGECLQAGPEEELRVLVTVSNCLSSQSSPSTASRRHRPPCDEVVPRNLLPAPSTPLCHSRVHSGRVQSAAAAEEMRYDGNQNRNLETEKMQLL